MTQSQDPTRDLTSTGELKQGSKDDKDNARTIVYPFGPYEILIRLSEDNKFIDVTEIRINKDFRSHSQRIISTGHHNVEQFYDK